MPNSDFTSTQEDDVTVIDPIYLLTITITDVMDKQEPSMTSQPVADYHVMS